MCGGGAVEWFYLSVALNHVRTNHGARLSAWSVNVDKQGLAVCREIVGDEFAISVGPVW